MFKEECWDDTKIEDEMVRDKIKEERGNWEGEVQRRTQKEGGGQWGISPLRSVESMVSREFLGPNGCWAPLERNWTKKMSFCHKLKFSNPYIFETWLCKASIFPTLIIWSYRVHTLKYQRFITLGCKDIGIRKSVFVQKLN